MGWGPQIFHCHDWHTSLLPIYLQTVYSWDRLFESSRTVLTLHNLGFQGVFPSQALADLDLQDHANLFYQEDLQAGRINFLKTGLLYASVITTVSQTYASEIQTSEQGMGLEGLLRQRRDSLIGIVNGVDYEEWSPDRDPLIPHTFSVDTLDGKRRNKRALLERMKLDPDLETPLLAIVSRLTSQKGFDLLFDTLPPALASGRARLVALGSGEERYAEFLQWLQSTFPGRAAFHRGYSNELAHLIEAGADIFLMPSRYEPCGLNQMYSLRYGTVPIVRKTGGLADTVQSYHPELDMGTGFVFEHFTPTGMGWALDLALRTFRDKPEEWRKMQRRGMEQDFSWNRQGRVYEQLYDKILGHG
jgi:starch synthase